MYISFQDHLNLFKKQLFPVLEILFLFAVLQEVPCFISGILKVHVLSPCPHVPHLLSMVGGCGADGLGLAWGSLVVFPSFNDSIASYLRAITEMHSEHTTVGKPNTTSVSF